MSAGKRVIRVGTRKSQLALAQTTEVVDALKARFPDIEFDIVERTTTGDQKLDVALSKIGDKGLFTKELETCLELGEVDLVVHSLKDLPTKLPDNMVIGAILSREDPRDVVLIKSGLPHRTLAELPEKSVIGTSSVRRAAQIRANFPHLEITDVRGNMNTRLRKLDDPEGQYSALIVAAAGIKRLGWEPRIVQYLEPRESLHAVSQGAIAVECRQDDPTTISVIQHLNDTDTVLACIAERTLMRTLEGGCSSPVAGHASVLVGSEGRCKLHLQGAVWSLDGRRSVRKAAEVELKGVDGVAPDTTSNGMYASIVASNLSPAHLEQAVQVGLAVAHQMLAAGAEDILREIRKPPLST